MYTILKATIWFSGLFVNEARAAGNTGCSGTGLTDPLCGLRCSDGTSGLECLASKAVDFLITISVPIVAIMVLYGGFQMMTAGGNPEKFKSGRQTILYAAVGFVVVLAAKGVVELIKSVFGV